MKVIYSLYANDAIGQKDTIMAQGRMLKKRISNSEKFAALKTNNARLLYLMIYPHLDCEGRLEANPKLIKGQILPLLNYAITKIKDYLEDMNRVGLIILYENNNDLFIEYTRFTDFQVLRKDREAESEIPAPSELQRNSVGTHPQVKLSKVKPNTREDKESKGFQPPSVQEISDYCKEKNIYVDAEDFIQSYGMKGWMVGKNKMRDWRLAVCRATKWEINRFKQPKPAPDKAAELEQQKQKVRDEYEEYLRNKSAAALTDLARDKKSHLYGVCGWLIDEIIAEKEK